jgi:hypothetical protein
MKALKLFGLNLLLVAAFAGCGGGSGVDVYVAGEDADNATLWKNGKAQNLENKSNYMASSVFVFDNDVWVSGKSMPTQNSMRQTKLWKNGKEQTFPIQATDIVSVYVSGNDVYMAGKEESVLGPNIAALWKNGEKQKLINRWENGAEVDCYFAYANLVFVSGNDVYVVGQSKNTGEVAFSQDGKTAYLLKKDAVTREGNAVAQDGKIVIELWKNGVKQQISDGTNDAFVTSLYVSGNDVYIVGNEKSAAKIWKNGEAQKLSNGIESSANSVFVSGNDVYVAGYEQNVGERAVAVLWKNGEAQKLTDGKFFAEANSVFVSGSDVYVVGYEGTKDEKFYAMLWKNGKAKKLTKAQTRANAYAVFVK